MKTIIAATGNRGKLKEIREILAGSEYTVVSMKEAGFDGDIDENGSTFEENALIKARAVCEATGEITLADDSGLAVDILGGIPGVRSARFAGEGASDAENNAKLLGMLEGIPFEKRTARFICAAAVMFPDGRHFTVKGSCEGCICFEPKGANGFGYDPLFYIPEYSATMAELGMEVKNRISHRGKAFRLLADELKMSRPDTGEAGRGNL